MFLFSLFLPFLHFSLVPCACDAPLSAQRQFGGPNVWAPQRTAQKTEVSEVTSATPKIQVILAKPETSAAVSEVRLGGDTKITP